eukprot:UN08392
MSIVAMFNWQTPPQYIVQGFYSLAATPDQIVQYTAQQQKHKHKRRAVRSE